MNTSLRKFVALTGLLVAAAFHAGSANAGCFSGDSLKALPQMQKQSWRGDSQPGLMKIDWRHHDDDVVGFWNIVVTAKGNAGNPAPFNPPDGVVTDRGLQQWHDDGTEFLNSSAQNPQTQNYCMGTWVQTGPYTYKLNHFAYQYDATGKVNGLVRIREEIKLSRDGDEMTGTQVVNIYDSFRNLLGTLKGVLVGKRITVDTTAQDIR